MKRTRAGVRLCLEPLEDRIVPSAPSEFQLTFATTTDSRTISVNYDISGSSLAGQTVNFNVYRSAGYKSLSGAQLIGTASIPGSDSADLSVGMHQGVKLSLTAPNGQPLTALTPNPALPFIVVSANPSDTAPGSVDPNDIASFETHVLGVIAHGFEFNPILLLTNQVPPWETQMAADLLHIDGYQAVIPFNWVRLSILPFPGPVEIAGDMLYRQVVTEADQLTGQHPGDVVDINFIGHSRGTVVISEVLQDLVGSNDPALRGGYMQMTLLDPHPANPLFSQFSFAPNISVAQDFAVLVFVVEFLMRDPQVIVPSNVLGVQEFDQQTLAGQLGFKTIDEILLNLWGELPSALPNQSSQPILSQNLTNVTAPEIGLIGHEQVPDWYLANVVDPDKTFDYFG